MRLLLAALFIATNLTGYCQQEEFISWSENTKVDWSAFKAKPDRASAFAAMSAVGIYYKYHATITGKSVTVTFEIDTRFDKTKSWSKSHQRTNHILKHEQLHFDICELIKRKFKKEAESTAFTSNYKIEIQNMFHKYSDWIHHLQQKYDEQTLHSANKVNQKNWENFIQQELSK